MNQTSEEIVDKAINDPEKIYKLPQSIVLDMRLTRAQKDKILRNWKFDQLAALRAEEENMIQKINSPSPVELLEKIQAAENSLKDSIKKGKTS